jgi:hypothetical protein
MAVILEIPDELYRKLEQRAREQGVTAVDLLDRVLAQSEPNWAQQLRDRGLLEEQRPEAGDAPSSWDAGFEPIVLDEPDLASRTILEGRR